MSTPSRLTAKEPIPGHWSVFGQEVSYPGILFIEDKRAFLRILAETSTRTSGTDWPDDQLKEFGPAKRVVILGDTSSAGRVTLFDCMQSNIVYRSLPDSGPVKIELTLLVSTVWAGTDWLDPDALYSSLSFDVPGLHSLISEGRVEHHWPKENASDPDSINHKLRLLTQADEVFLISYGQGRSVEIMHEGSRFRIKFLSHPQFGLSKVDGPHFALENICVIESNGSTIDSLREVSYQIEQFLSLICIGAFRRKHITLHTTEIGSTRLIWNGKRDDGPKFTSMPHQALATLSQEPKRFMDALRNWFAADEEIKLARWLIVDALNEITSSTSRFLSVSQAWEIIGRKLSIKAATDKPQLAAACDAAKVELDKHLSAEVSARLYQLLRTSNLLSLKDLVRAVIAEIPSTATSVVCPDVDNFVKKFVTVRNTLTHMEGKKTMSIERASYFSLFLTYKLVVLFCVFEVVKLGLPDDSISSALANNRFALSALRPLPH